MMRWIIGSSLKFRLLVVAVARGHGHPRGRAAPRPPIDVLPEFPPPRMEIQTACIGLSASEVEALVPTPMEETFNGPPGLDVLRSKWVEIVLVALLGLGLVACQRDEPVIDPGDGGNYTVRPDPAAFVERIDNPWLPFTPGSRWVYEAGGGERNEVVVTNQTRKVMGITATVVHDTETRDGELVERTADWYAQDRDGNVWYLGEDTTAYEDGQPSSAGSWEAGVDGALPGIIMKANPQVGDAYRQEYHRGEAEDMGKVVRVGDTETVPFRSFDGLLVTQDWTPLEPEVVEEKFYAKGVGLVLETTIRGGADRNELVSYQPGE